MSKTKQELSEINPFVANNPLEVVALPKKDFLPLSTEVSEVGDDLLRLQQTHYLYDRQRKITVYGHTQEYINNLLYGRLNPRGRDLYLYILYHLPEERDYISLKLSDVRSATGISKNSIVEGLKRLKAAGVITPKSQSVYWINPKFFFRGNRIDYYLATNREALVVKSIIKKQ